MGNKKLGIAALIIAVAASATAAYALSDKKNRTKLAHTILRIRLALAAKLANIKIPKLANKK